MSSAPPPASKPASIDLESGTRLGKYRILKRLATGGMAEIFLASVSGLPGYQKMVVIKRILPQLATKSDFIEMFLDEARIAATLQHANLVQMYDVGVVEGNYFIAMEYLHGEDLRSVQKAVWKRQEPMPLDVCIASILGVASGLHYAHEKVGYDGTPLNIIHRDVTPQNVIVTYDGTVKLLDFGIAKASNRLGETRFGTLKGKVPYMSPEQCRGEQLDRRSDIFSLGIMLYELTLGRRLYKGKSDFEVLKQIVEGTVEKPTSIDPKYPPLLEKIVMKALEKERDNRYQTVREMQEELEELAHEARLRVSATHLAGFMKRVFGSKIEAWHEAQAQGKSLGEHLEEALEEIIEIEHVDEEEAAEELRIRKERNELRRSIDARPVTLEAPPGKLLPGGSPIETTLPVRKTGGRSMLWWIPGGIALVAIGGLLAYVLVPKKTHAPPPVAAIAPVAPPPVAAKVEPPPAPPAPPAPPVAEEKPAPEPEKPVVAAAEPAPSKRDRSSRHRSRGTAVATPVAAPAAKPAPAAPVKLEGEGTLVVSCNPWAEVSVDGQARGQTPVSLKLPAGKHSVVLTNPEFKINRSLSVMILPNETVRKKLDFAQ